VPAQVFQVGSFDVTRFSEEELWARMHQTAHFYAAMEGNFRLLAYSRPYPLDDGAGQGHDGRGHRPPGAGADRRLPPLHRADRVLRLPEGYRVLPGALERQVTPPAGQRAGRGLAPAGVAHLAPARPAAGSVPRGGQPPLPGATGSRSAARGFALHLRSAGPTQPGDDHPLPGAAFPVVLGGGRADHPPRPGAAHSAVRLQQAASRRAQPQRQRGPRSGERAGVPGCAGGDEPVQRPAPGRAPGRAGHGRPG